MEPQDGQRVPQEHLLSSIAFESKTLKCYWSEPMNPHDSRFRREASIVVQMESVSDSC